MVVVPPIAELDASLIHRLYAQLSKMPASVVILDEAEGLIGESWLRTHDSDGLPALLAALDGVSRPRSGPITLALTTAEPSQLDPAAVRAGRLAPQLVLGEPSAGERRLLLERAVSGLPSVGQIELQVLVDRTNGWTGAELVTAVETACARSLLDHTDALRMDLLLEVIGEHYTVHDLRPATPEVLRTYALHEAGHALYAELTWPGLVESVSIDDRSGSTVLPEEVENSRPSLGHLRELAAMSLAGEAAERLVLGHAQTSVGGTTDRAKATSYLLSLLAIGRPFDPDALERGDNTDRGSERMRADLYAEVMREARAALTEAEVTLAAHRGAIPALAASLLAAPDRSLSGAALHEALQAALTQPGEPFHG
jgi:ATP-dependent Zn protease